MEQVTTISFFKYTNFKNKVWAFGMMQFAHKHLAKVKGLSFYKLLGTGKDRFNPFPDWSVYAMLQIWENEEAADDYFRYNPLFVKYQIKTNEHWVVFLKNIIARGEWEGSNPFKKSKEKHQNIPNVVALTRATIKTKLLLKFWRFVPKSQTQLWDNEGLIYTKGIGEIPFKQMATFSIWKDEASLNAFAYQSRGHVEAIGKTRKLDWYNEELFARFKPYKQLGSWKGVSEVLPLSKLERK